MLEAIAPGLGEYQVGIAHLFTQLDEISRALVEVRGTVRKVLTELQRTTSRLNDELRVMRRPANYVDLSSEARLEIDRQLGIGPEPSDPSNQRFERNRRCLITGSHASNRRERPVRRRALAGRPTSCLA